jgi:hypothetical protein
MRLGGPVHSPPCAYASVMRMPRNTLAAFSGTVKVLKHAMDPIDRVCPGVRYLTVTSGMRKASRKA